MTKKRLLVLFLIFVFGLLSGWALEKAGFLGYGLTNPELESWVAKIWPFRFWNYLW